jgi:hypothetical protein
MGFPIRQKAKNALQLLISSLAHFVLRILAEADLLRPTAWDDRAAHCRL